MEDPSYDGSTSIIHLPDDCLDFIFQWLDYNSDRESFGLTCRRWLNIQNISRRSLQLQCSFAVLTSPTLSQTNFGTTSYHLSKLLTRFQHLLHLSLSGCTDLPDSSLNFLQHCGSKLECLNMDCCFGISDDGLSLVGNNCPVLKTISLYRCNITDIGLQSLANACSTLTHVDLSYCSRISDTGLRALSKGCCQLKAIKVYCCRGITGVGLTGCFPNLIYLDAESSGLKQDGIDAIVSGGRLEFINISGVSSLPRNVLAGVDPKFLSRLKILNLRMCRSIGDESIINIAKGCPLIQELNLGLCHEVRIPGWESIGLYCNSLKKLHVNRCRNLCDRGLQALRDGCKKLTVLYMNGNCNVSVVAVELFQMLRGQVEIKAEEYMFIGPHWTSIS